MTTQYTNPYYGIFYGAKNSNPLIVSLSGEFNQFSPQFFLAQTEIEVINKANDLGLTNLDSNQSIYFNLPNGHSIANIRRAGSSTLTTIIANTFFPDLSEQDGLHINTVIPLSSVPTGTPHAIVRDPIDRFISAYAKKLMGVPSNLNVEDFISWLIKQDKGTLNWHFRPQTIIIGNFENINYYDFNKGLDTLGVAIGLPTPLPTLNETDITDKPVLTQDQINILKDYYTDDVALYQKISNT